MRGQSRDWTRSVDRGTCRLGIELRNNRDRSADAVQHVRKATRRIASASVRRALRSLRPQACMETPCARTGRPHRRPHGMRRAGRRSHKPEVQHARRWGVGQSRSTGEGPNKAGNAGGGHGGKASDQGERQRTNRAPDSEPEQRVERLARCAGSRTKEKRIRFTTLLHHVTDSSTARQLLS